MTEAGWTVAGRYRVLGRIGAGGMADVLRARDELLDREVAVKVFRTVVTGPDGETDTAKGVERQQAELAALARLNHPNLTMLYDGSIVGQDGPAYLVMELVEGPSLAQAIAEGGLDEGRARVVGAQIGEALAYVHAAGMVHRDVKPANILLGRDRSPSDGGMRARLTDFGIVRLVGNEPLTRADMTLGSASYLAPEQARGSAVGPPADVYSLGLTLIEALTGRRSFDGPALEAVVARLSQDPAIPAGLPEPWPGLLRAMTARDPALRPTADRVAATLRGSESLTAPISSVPAGAYDTAVLPVAVAAAASAPPPRPPVRPAGVPPWRAEPPPRRGWSASLIIAGVLVLALVIAGIALLVANSGDGGGSGGAPSTPASTTPGTPTSSSTSGPSTGTSPTRTRKHRSSSADTSTSNPASTPESTTPTTPPDRTSPTRTTPSTSSSASSSPSPSTSASTSSSRTRGAGAAGGAGAAAGPGRGNGGVANGGPGGGAAGGPPTPPG